MHKVQVELGKTDCRTRLLQRISLSVREARSFVVRHNGFQDTGPPLVGNTRRGLVARCRREDGTEYRVSLADVEVAPEAAGHQHISAYCKWLGVEPAAPQRNRSANAKVREHKANDDDIDLTRPVELIVLVVKERAARCRLPTSGRTR